MNNEQELSIGEQQQIRREKLAELVKTGRDPFQIVKFDKTHGSEQILGNFEKFEGKTVSVAGRIILKRMMGKASFTHILDGDGKIQLYVSVNDVGEPAYEEFKKIDLGDIVGVTGTVFKTRTGEVSVQVTKIQLLSKSLIPLPDKHSGLKDPDLRYRERYVDMIANPEVKNVFVMRSKIITAMREFLDTEGFIEVETPILQTIPGGAEARPFVTHHNTLNLKMYMRIAPELYLKRLIVGGMEKVYEVGRVFRNEGMSPKHNPEFTLMELYQAYTDYHGMMDITERMFKHILDKVIGTRKITFEDTQIDMSGKWRKVTMVDAVREVAGLDFNKLTAKEAEQKLKGKIEMPKTKTWGTLLYAAFDQLVEKTLIQPTFLMDYPVEVSPLAKRKPTDPRIAERFELFMNGWEMGNAYSELNDPIDQRARFEEQVKERAKGNDEAHMMDDDFINAIEYGMPPTGGLGVGIDRMIILFTNQRSIRDVLLFPTMKPTK